MKNNNGELPGSGGSAGPSREIRNWRWQCGTPVYLGDIVEYGERKVYTGEVYWSEYLQSYEVSVGTGLTLSEDSIDEFRFVRRGAAGKENNG